MVDFDDGDFIDEAEQLTSGESAEKILKLQLEVGTLKYLHTFLFLERIKTTVLDYALQRSPTIEDIHPDGMMSVLIEKLKNLVGENNDKPTISIELSQRESGFIDDKLALAIKRTKLSRQVDDDMETTMLINGTTLDTLTKRIPVFREYNLALLKAGGTPHPDAFKMFDDLNLP
ncbi:MAG: hypothetical protein PHQ59_04905 [Candidatus Daviesbacteria bacterium]|nr:hypothetical protein [Candidatus Daviesbacteria bacterium]